MAPTTPPVMASDASRGSLPKPLTSFIGREREAGASTEEVTLSPDALKPPCDEVAELLREHGIGHT